MHKSIQAWRFIGKYSNKQKVEGKKNPFFHSIDEKRHTNTIIKGVYVFW